MLLMIRLIWAILLGIIFTCSSPVLCSKNADDTNEFLAWKKARTAAPLHKLRSQQKAPVDPDHVTWPLGSLPTHASKASLDDLVAHLSFLPPEDPSQGFAGAQSDVICIVFLHLDDYPDIFNLALIAKKFNAAFHRLPILVEGARAAFQNDLRRFLLSTVESCPSVALFPAQCVEIAREASAMDTYEGYKSFVKEHGSIRSLLRSGKMLRCYETACTKAINPTEKKYQGCKLRGVPTIIFMKSSCKQEIYLSHNSLERLPPEISLCASLVTLQLHNNSLSKLPTEFRKLKSLRSLTLSYNLFEEFPTEVLSLTSLRDLYLHGNMIKHIPPEISNLKHLELFHIQGNPLEDLPESIIRLRKLTFFLPSSLTYLPPLTEKQKKWLARMGGSCNIL